MSGGASLVAALAVEARKMAASRVVHTTTVLLVGGVGLLAGALTLAAESGNEQVLAQLGPLADVEGWERLVGVVAQITAAGGLLGFGVVLSWSVGREFTEGTIGGLFALPVLRSAIAAAKLAVFTVWAIATAALLVALVAALGAVMGLLALDGGTIAALARLFSLAVLSAVLAIPAALAATLGRGLLPGIGTTVGMVVLTQVAVVAGTGAWFPVAAPALWAASPTDVAPVQLALVAVVPLVFGALTLTSWSHLQLDRS